jgi:hypothetical protein
MIPVLGNSQRWIAKEDQYPTKSTDCYETSNEETQREQEKRVGDAEEELTQVISSMLFMLTRSTQLGQQR